jgi:hypothetical protein
LRYNEKQKNYSFYYKYLDYYSRMIRMAIN